MKFDFPIRRQDASVSLAVEGFDNPSGTRSGAYACVVDTDRRYELWGIAGIRNTETLYAYGLHHALNVILYSIEKDDPSVLAWVPSTGWQKYVKTYVPRWIANGGKNSSGKIPDGYDAWKYLHDIETHVRISYERSTPKRGMLDVTRCHEAAKRFARLAHERSAHRQVGVLQDGECWADGLAGR